MKTLKETKQEDMELLPEVSIENFIHKTVNGLTKPRRKKNKIYVSKLPGFNTRLM